MTPGIEDGYSKRDVNYSLIHSESKEVFARFIEAINLKEGTKVLDIGGGYGSVLVNSLEKYSNLKFQYDLLDSSPQQLEKAKKHINEYLKDHPAEVTVNYIHQNAVKLTLPVDTYDVVVCKMMIHEVPLVQQEQLLKKIYFVLKPGACILLWTADLEEHDHAFYRDTIRKKDELAEFHSFLENRHFLLNEELVALLEESGFKNTEKLFEFDYELHTSLRLQSEFKDNKQKLTDWHDYIIEISDQLSAEAKKKLIIAQSDDNIHIRFKRAVFKAIKG